jgi:hypothetical protein
MLRSCVAPQLSPAAQRDAKRVSPHFPPNIPA